MLNWINAAGTLVEGFARDVTDYETTSNYRTNVLERAIEILDEVPGMTSCRTSLFKRSSLKFSLRDGSSLRTWTNRAVGGDHVFLADPNNNLVYCGFVWLYSDELKQAIRCIKSELT